MNLIFDFLKAGGLMSSFRPGLKTEDFVSELET
jgi:hypothetical protein